MLCRSLSSRADTLVKLSAFRRKDLEPFAFAGVLEFARLDGVEILSAAMIVGEPNPLVGGVHDRMPVMLLPEGYMTAGSAPVRHQTSCSRCCGPTMLT